MDFGLFGRRKILRIFFAPIFAPIFNFSMELELKLEWLEGVSEKSGGLATPCRFFDTPSSHSNFNSNSIKNSFAHLLTLNSRSVLLRTASPKHCILKPDRIRVPSGTTFVGGRIGANSITTTFD